jgi:hypothetical protein
VLDQMDRRLSDWARSLLGEVEITLDPPHAKRDGRGVHLYLVDVRPDPTGRGERRPPLQIAARYLVSTWSEDLASAHHDLATLMFAAMQSADLRVEPEGPDVRIWDALGMPPHPAIPLSSYRCPSVSNASSPTARGC